VLSLTRDDFTIEPELAGEMCRRKGRIYELPIVYYGGTHCEGKEVAWHDVFRAVCTILELLLRSPAEGLARSSRSSRSS